MDGQREEGGSKRVPLLDTSGAVDGAVSDDEREGRLVAEVSSRCDLGKGLPESLQDGGPVCAVEDILDVDKHHHLVRLSAVLIHPLPCCVHIAFCPMRSSDADLEGQHVLDPALHYFESNFPASQRRVSPTT